MSAPPAPSIGNPAMEEEISEHKDYVVSSLKNLNVSLGSNYTWDVDWVALCKTVVPQHPDTPKFVKRHIIWPMGHVGDGIARALKRGAPTKQTFTSRVTNKQFKFKPASKGQGNEFAIENGQLIFYRRNPEVSSVSMPLFEEDIVERIIGTLFADDISPAQKVLRSALCVDSDFNGVVPEYFNEIVSRIPSSMKRATPHCISYANLACMHYNLGTCVRTLVQANANVNVANKTGSTPLHVACTGNAYKEERLMAECVSILAQSGKVDANAINNLGLTGLHCAAMSDYLKLAAAVLHSFKNLDLEIKDKKGKTALDYAVAKNAKSTVALLESYKSASSAAKPAATGASKPSASAVVTSTTAPESCADKEAMQILALLSEIVADDLKEGSAKQATLRKLTYNLKKRYGL